MVSVGMMMRMAIPPGAPAALLLLIAGLPGLAGCAGYGDTVELEIRSEAGSITVPGSQETRLKVAVAPFLDGRADTSRLGTLTRFGDARTVFQVAGDDLGEMMAQAMIEYLKRRQGWRAWIAKQGVRPPEGGPDVTLSGRVLECSANAESWPAGTRVTANTAIAVQVLNRGDGSTVRLTLDSHDSQWLFSFEPHDLERVLQRTLHGSFEKLLAATEVERRVLRLKETEKIVPDQGAGTGQPTP